MPAANQGLLPAALRISSTGLAQSSGGTGEEDIVDREIAVSRQEDGISDWRAKEGSPTN